MYARVVHRRRPLWLTQPARRSSCCFEASREKIFQAFLIAVNRMISPSTIFGSQLPRGSLLALADGRTASTPRGRGARNETTVRRVCIACAVELQPGSEAQRAWTERVPGRGRECSHLAH